MSCNVSSKLLLTPNLSAFNVHIILFLYNIICKISAKHLENILTVSFSIDSNFQMTKTVYARKIYDSIMHKNIYERK